MSWDNYRYFADISSNNATLGGGLRLDRSGFDAQLYSQAGHTTIAIKVSEGRSYINPFWREWTQDAHKAHLCVVLYHFADSGSDGASQAMRFIGEIAASRLYLPRYDAIFLDIEQGGGVVDPAAYKETFEAFTRNAGFTSLGVYSDAAYLLQYGVGLKPMRGGTWVADLGSGPLPGGWFGQNPWARQYSWTNRVKGLSKPPTDMNRMALIPALWRKAHRP